METLLAALDMGRYDFYVWGSYATAAVVLGASVLSPWLRLRALRARLREGRAAREAVT